MGWLKVVRETNKNSESMAKILIDGLKMEEQRNRKYVYFWVQNQGNGNEIEYQTEAFEINSG